MIFFTSNENINNSEENIFDKLKNHNSFVKCRNCNGDHWTLLCLHKNVKNKLKLEENESAQLDTGNSDEKIKTHNKYIVPNLRGFNSKKIDSFNNKGFDSLAIRISNLSPNTTDHDLEELVKPFGPISKLYLPKYKNNGLCKGFAFIHFKSKLDAHAAIKALDKHGYDHLILQVDWSTSTN